MIWVKNAWHVRDFVVHVVFGDESEFDVDLRDSLQGAIYQPLHDPRVFAALTYNPDVETIVWDCGADFAPEYLYDLGKQQAASRSHVA